MFSYLSKTFSKSSPQDKERQSLINRMKSDPSERPTMIISSIYNPETQRMKVSALYYSGYTRYDQALMSKYGEFDEKCLEKIESINTGSIEDRQAWSQYDQDTINEKLRERVNSVKTENPEYQRLNFDCTIVNPAEFSEIEGIDCQRVQVDPHDNFKKNLQGYLCLITRDRKSEDEPSNSNPENIFERRKPQKQVINMMVCQSAISAARQSEKSQNLDYLQSIARKHREHFTRENSESPTIANTREYLKGTNVDVLPATISEGAAKVYPALHPVHWD